MKCDDNRGDGEGRRSPLHSIIHHENEGSNVAWVAFKMIFTDEAPADQERQRPAGSGWRATDDANGMVCGRHLAARCSGNVNKAEMGTMWV